MIDKALKWSKSIKLKNWNFNDIIAPGQVTHLNKLLGTIIPGRSQNLLGYHFLFANQLNENLGTDGYDNYQAPVSDTQLFRRRMWVKGEIEFINPLSLGSYVNCQEVVSNVRLMNNSTFVEIVRHFKSETDPILKEKRTLIYTNDNYNQPLASVVDSTYHHSINFNVDDTQLSKYSFLTYNLHKIHLDKEYSKNEGFPDRIVQGPLLVTIILNWFHTNHPDLDISTIKYKITNPVYVNEQQAIYWKKKGNVFEVLITNGINISLNCKITLKGIN